jgi:hypothetical protein
MGEATGHEWPPRPVGPDPRWVFRQATRPWLHGDGRLARECRPRRGLFDRCGSGPRQFRVAGQLPRCHDRSASDAVGTRPVWAEVHLDELLERSGRVANLERDAEWWMVRAMSDAGVRARSHSAARGRSRAVDSGRWPGRGLAPAGSASSGSTTAPHTVRCLPSPGRSRTLHSPRR